MPTEFETDFAAEQFPILLESFGESVTYTPSGGSASTVSAILNRNPLQELGPDGIRIERQHELWVSSAAVSQCKVGDTVAVRKRLGDAALTTMRVTIAEDAGGVWHLWLN